MRQPESSRARRSPAVPSSRRPRKTHERASRPARRTETPRRTSRLARESRNSWIEQPLITRRSTGARAAGPDGGAEEHRQVDRGAQRPGYDPAPDVRGEDGGLLGQLHDRDDRDEGGVLQKCHEIVRHRRQRQAESLRASHQPQDLPLGQAERSRGLELHARDGLEGSAVDLALVGGVVQSEAEESRGERGEPDEGRQAVVEDEKLQQDRGAAHELDVAGQRAPDGDAAVDAPRGDADSQQDGESHRGAGKRERDERRAQERGDVPQRRGPRRRNGGTGAGGRRSFRTRGENRPEEFRLRIVPDSPFPVDRLERAVAHPVLEDSVDPVAQRGVAPGEDADEDGRDRRRFDREARDPAGQSGPR